MPRSSKRKRLHLPNSLAPISVSEPCLSIAAHADVGRLDPPFGRPTAVPPSPSQTPSLSTKQAAAKVNGKDAGKVPGDGDVDVLSVHLSSPVVSSERAVNRARVSKIAPRTREAAIPQKARKKREVRQKTFRDGEMMDAMLGEGEGRDTAMDLNEPGSELMNVSLQTCSHSTDAERQAVELGAEMDMQDDKEEVQVTRKHAQSTAAGSAGLLHATELLKHSNEAMNLEGAGTALVEPAAVVVSEEEEEIGWIPGVGFHIVSTMPAEQPVEGTGPAAAKAAEEPGPVTPLAPTCGQHHETPMAAILEVDFPKNLPMSVADANPHRRQNHATWRPGDLTGPAVCRG
ncbi:hypothetical protein HDU96_004073 [Phlyctochytrium bullatum]|nr:hypothetical protein HDU96_004073 [Phlyctochytrium bullatum]